MRINGQLTRYALLAAALTASWALVRPAAAALGGDANSVSADSAALEGQLHATPMVNYEVQQITRGSLQVHEYLSSQGQVFALTWHGPTPPDLRLLLGAYFERFQSAAAAHRTAAGGHRQLSILRPDLVLQSSGRLRDFAGLAYVPALVPSGFALSSLQ